MNEPIFVEIIIGEDSAGNKIKSIRCICEVCQKLTAPIHFWGDYKNKEANNAANNKN